MPQQDNKLQPLDISKMTLDDVDKVSNDVLHSALESVIRRPGEPLNHQSHGSHGSRIGPTEPMEVVEK